MIRTVAVAGGGIMGQGIAQVCAASGFATLIYDIRKEQVNQAIININKNLERSVEKGKLTGDQQAEIMARIKPADSPEALKSDLLIEAAVERIEVKQELFAKLEKVNGGKIILASNTSSLSITKIASSLQDPSRCAGLHFFNPAEKMRLVEIISGEKTDLKVIGEIHDFAIQIGKTPVTAKDSPGFIVNRVARHFYGESLKLLEQGRTEASVIDALMRSSGFKMGPFELMDLIGLDTNLAVTESVYEGFQKNPKFKPSPIQQRLVSEGNFGRKTGRGFYQYEQ